MVVKHLRIDRFRGIRSLDWNLGGRFMCLVGPGDSTKTTILNAIELALTPRRSCSFDDADFYGADTSSPFVVEVTVCDLPQDLLSLSKFGSFTRGWHDERGLRDEPADDDQPALTIALTVDADLEATWAVITNREPEGKRISAADRARLGASRIGGYIDWHLCWGPASPLTRLMDEKEDVSPVLADARRQVRSSLDLKAVPRLVKSAAEATEVGKPVGANASGKEGFLPGIDARNLTLGGGVLALHDGGIPLRQAGMGTSRLLATALQHEASVAGGVTLIDEVEYGLEPHRLRRLLALLRRGRPLRQASAEAGATTEAHPSEKRTQTLLTTHSTIPLTELEPDELRVVRSRSGNTVIRTPTSSLAPLLRKNPEAFLARKVIVCEGKTEIGLCRAFDRRWASADRSFQYSGIALANGGGNTEGPATALGLASLGYSVLFFGDSDEPASPGVDALHDAGAATALWPGDVSTEERVALDLPWEGFVEMVQQAVDDYGKDHVRARLAAELGRPLADLPLEPVDWPSVLDDREAMRTPFARAAKNKRASWFKRVGQAERLGRIVLGHWDEVAAKGLGQTLTTVEHWVYE